VATLIGVRASASAASKHALPARSSGPMEDSLDEDQPEGQDAGDVLSNGVASRWCTTGVMKPPGRAGGFSLCGVFRL
jgi:hypothetical protein